MPALELEHTDTQKDLIQKQKNVLLYIGASPVSPVSPAPRPQDGACSHLRVETRRGRT